MASRIEKKDLSNYLAEARSWETDKMAQLQASAKKAWIVAIAAGVIAIVSVITVAILGPQKTVVPYLVRVDNATGTMDVVKPVKDALTSYGEVLNKYNLQLYIRWREGYSRHTVAEYYNNVGYMSAPKVQHQYATFMSKNNPNSPLRRYGRGAGEAVVTVKSMTFVKTGVGIVRFSKQIFGERGGLQRTEHWLATITYLYSDVPQSESTRAINPLGFQVLEYRLDADQTVGENPANRQQAEPSASQLIPAPELTGLPETVETDTPQAIQ
jgi:type IV secretion system protein VirB8